MTLALGAAMTGPGRFDTDLPCAACRPEAPPPGPAGWGEPPDCEAGEAQAVRWPWDARLIGFLATAAAICWGVLIAATLGLLDWLA